jgi:hypothetical protein
MKKITTEPMEAIKELWTQKEVAHKLSVDSVEKVVTCFLVSSANLSSDGLAVAKVVIFVMTSWAAKRTDKAFPSLLPMLDL